MRTSRNGGVLWKLPAHRVQGSSCPGGVPRLSLTVPPQPKQAEQMGQLATDRWQSLIQQTLSQGNRTEYAVAQHDLPSAFGLWPARRVDETSYTRSSSLLPPPAPPSVRGHLAAADAYLAISCHPLTPHSLLTPTHSCHRHSSPAARHCCSALPLPITTPPIHPSPLHQSTKPPKPPLQEPTSPKCASLKVCNSRMLGRVRLPPSPSPFASSVETSYLPTFPTSRSLSLSSHLRNPVHRSYLLNHLPKPPMTSTSTPCS